MDRLAVAVTLLLCIATVTVAAPLERHDVDDDVTAITTSAEPTSPHEGNLVLVAREEEEEELLPSEDGDVATPVFYRDEEEIISTPILLNPPLLVGVEEDDVDVLGGELMETANSGLVFRPQFRYRKQSRRRYNRNTRRRYAQPFFGF